MKKTIQLFIFFVNISIYSQTVTVTALEKPKENILYEPGIDDNSQAQTGENVYTYNCMFDSEGKFIEYTNFCLDLKDIPLKNGFLEFKDDKSTKQKGLFYTSYNGVDGPKLLDFQSLTGNANGEVYGVSEQNFISDHFIVRVDNTYYKMSEDLKIQNAFTRDTKNDINTLQMCEVLSDGCLYLIYFTEAGFRLEKIDVVNQNQLTLEIPIPKGLSFIEEFPYRYNEVMATPSSYHLSINKNGSKVFFGFCPGESKVSYGGVQSHYVQSKQGCFYIIDGKDFSIEAEHTFEFEPEHLEAAGVKGGIPNPYIEDVFFNEEDVYVTLTHQASYGINPQAIYKISIPKKEISLYGVLTNKSDDVLSLNRGNAKTYLVNNKIYLIYSQLMSDDRNYKIQNKTYQTMHIVDITDGEFKIKMIKDGFEDFKGYINTISGAYVGGNGLLFLAYTLGGFTTAQYNLTHAIRLNIE